MALDMFYYSFSISGLLCLLTIKLSEGEIFVVSPGDGRDFVYSPVDRNATISCAVSEEILEWVVDDGLSFESRTQALVLDSRRIFKSSTEVSNGVTTSSVAVFCDIDDNNGTQVCCQTIANGKLIGNCTTLIIYDRPSPPEQVLVNYMGNLNFNISWTAPGQAQVAQNYSVIIYSLMYPVETSMNYYIHEITKLTTYTCGVFLAYVKAVNGAGESDPSNNVTIPSLPDIEPVTASLTHQVWKSNGHIMVNVSFEQAQYCKEYPVLTYNVTLGQQPMGELIAVNVSGNETEVEVLLGPEDRLGLNQRYVVTVVAVTAVGSVASNSSNILITSDLQAVNFSLANDLTLNLECTFISGSDATGCYIVIFSNQVKNETATLSREQGALYASGHHNLTHKSHCYDRVLAFNIDKHNITSNFSVETELPGRANIACSGTVTSLVITVLITLFAITAIITVLIITLLLVKKLKANNRGKQVSPLKTNYQTQQSLKKSNYDIQNKECSPPCLVDTQQRMADTSDLQSSLMWDNKDKNAHEDVDCDATSSTNTAPIYAVPHKTKKDSGSEGHTHREQHETCKSTSERHNYLDDKAHIYHMLENTEGEDPKALIQKTNLKTMQSNTEKEDCGVSSTQNDLRKSHERKGNEEDHIYHVLEQSEVPDAVPLAPSHDAPQLPPPFDPDNFTPTPVYQDITELQTKQITELHIN